MTQARVTRSAFRGPVNHGVLSSGLFGVEAPEEILHEVLRNKYQMLGRRQALDKPIRILASSSVLRNDV